jgi:hypothetical protein
VFNKEVKVPFKVRRTLSSLGTSSSNRIIAELATDVENKELGYSLLCVSLLLNVTW